MLSSLYSKIGVAGFILISIGLVSMFLFLKNTLMLWYIKRDFKTFFDDLESGEKSIFDDQHNMRNPLIAIIVEVARQHVNHSSDIRSEVAYLFHRHFNKVSTSITILRLISVIAPLLGLMGTMIGMVNMFRSLGVATADATLLASGIWVALLTTILGLTVAIPTLAFYYFLQLRMKDFRITAIEFSYRVLGIVNPLCPYGNKNEVITEKCIPGEADARRV